MLALDVMLPHPSYSQIRLHDVASLAQGTFQLVSCMADLLL